MKNEHAVVIAGGGPTGLMLGAELALAGVDVAIVERRADQTLTGWRAGGLHARTLELLDQRGVVDRFLAEGQKAQVAGFAYLPLDISDFPTRHNYGLALWQRHIERILAGWVTELPVRFYRSAEVTGFTQDEGGVEVQLGDGRGLRGQYLVGCDGGRSVVRKAAGIGFPGWEPSISCLMAEAPLTAEPPWGMRRDATGIHAFSKPEAQGRVRVMVTERAAAHEGEPTVEQLREALTAVFGTDFGLHNPDYVTRFTDMARQADTYRAGRVLLAGDAAHVHNPVGGQGLNLGLADAVNLGWKLAQVVKGHAPDALLDTYHSERHPVGARVLRNTLAQVLFQRMDDRVQALSGVLSELLKMDEPRQMLAAIQSGLDVHYDLGAGHPLLGRRMPDLDLITSTGPTRVYALLRTARPLLLNLGAPGALDAGRWAERVGVIDARCEGPWQLPVLGVVPPPAAVLIRPDGHVAWVGEGSDHGLTQALTTWFGKP